MTTTQAEAGAAAPGAVPPGERSVVAGIRGLRWWATLLLALVFTVAGVAADILRSGQLGLIFMVCFPVGCVLAVVWVRRSELFGPMVQPPLLLAVTVPVVVVVTGSLPKSGGVVSTALAIGGPLINGFPTLAITTAVCAAGVFVRWKLQPYARPGDDDGAATPGPTRPVSSKGAGGGKGSGKGSGAGQSSGGGKGPGGGKAPAGGPAPKADRRPPRDDRPRDDRARDDRPRDDRARGDRPRDDRPRDDRRDERPRPRDPDARAPGVYRVSSTGETEKVDREQRRPPKPPR